MISNHTSTAPIQKFSDLTKDVAALFRSNSRQYGTNLYTVPSPITYPYQFLWDSCFHAIIYSHLDSACGKSEIRSLLARQFKNGMVPHLIYWRRGPAIDIDWGQGRRTSNITQPPMIAYAVWQLFQKDQDTEFLKEIYPNLFHYYKYLLNDRDPHDRNLLGVINPDESGEDNSPRFDALLGLPPIHTFEENLKKRIDLVQENIKCRFDAPFCMNNFFWVKDVPFNAIMIENLQCLSYIAQKVGREYDAAYFDRSRELIAKAMRNLMFEDGLFWSTHGENYQKIKVKTWAMFAPLFARILEKKEAEKLINEHLLNNKEFWGDYALTTVSKDEAAFSETDMWRGPVWIGINWFVYKGLINYGFNEVAIKIKQSSLALIKKSGFREYYNPITGNGLGAKNFTWGGLVLDMD